MILCFWRSGRHVIRRRGLSTISLTGTINRKSCLQNSVFESQTFRSVESPRGLKGLTGHDLQRVAQDNFSSDYAIALQHGHQHGLACMRENPLRSLHWHDPNEVGLHSQGGWMDFDYDACVFLGARKKAQRLRRNILEFQSLPHMRCGHVRDMGEWTKSGTRYPTFEEAEYTPSLVYTIAVVCTAWSVRLWS